jgi:plastocyanin
MRMLQRAAAAAAIVLVAACGGGASPTPSGASSAPSTAPSTAPGGGGSCAVAAEGTTASATVDIRGFAFSPATVTVAAGQTVAWTNGDDAPHTATPSDAGCDTGSLSKGETGALTFESAGTYAYRCTIHPTMSGTVEVT